MLEYFVPLVFLIFLSSFFYQFLILLIIPFSNAKEKSENAFTDQIIIIIIHIICITFFAFLIDHLWPGSKMKQGTAGYFSNQLSAIKGVIGEIYHILAGVATRSAEDEANNILDVWYSKGLEPLFTSFTDEASVFKRRGRAVAAAASRLARTGSYKEKQSINRLWSIMNILSIIVIIYKVFTKGGKLSQGTFSKKLLRF